jgi:GNAT superfamily N-acetyltransferase
MKITKATIENIPLIKEIAEKSWRKHYPGILSNEQIEYMLEQMYSETELKNHFENPNYHYYLLSDDENFLGIMGFENHYQKDTTKLHRIYLLEEAKGKGVGKFAINFLKNQAKESGDQRIILAVNKQNSSYHFYTSQGFKIYEEGVFEIGNGYVMDDYLMEFYL